MQNRREKFGASLAFTFWFGVGLALLPQAVGAANLTIVNDTLSSSRPEVNANHTIKFTLTNTVPALGKIIITPQAGLFNIPVALGESDIDLLDDGVNLAFGIGGIEILVVAGTEGRITFTLANAVIAGSVVTVKIGTNATFGATGSQQIQNPASSGSYRIVIETQNALGGIIDKASAMVAILPAVTLFSSFGLFGAPPSPPAPSPAPSGGGGGGDGGYLAAPETKVVFSGRAYPGMKVTVLKDAQIAAQALADPAANFRVAVSGLSAGGYIFGVYSEDSQGRRSSLLTFPVTVTSGVTVEMGNIFIAPTIAVDKSEVKRGENIAIFGQSVPKADVTVAISSEEEFFGKIIADAGGAYLYNFDTAQLEKGQHLTKSKAAIGGAISSFGKTVSFAVGAKTVFAQPSKCPAKADLNNDCQVNLVDFSIAAYWHKRSLSTEFKSKEAERLSGDGKVDLIDFSIMAFYWTG